jgi:serine carboxypeptidase-like clade II
MYEKDYSPPLVSFLMGPTIYI